MKYAFKTNINCGGCVAKVQPVLDEAEAVESWTVNTEHPDKILEIEASKDQQEALVALVESAGFRIEPRRRGWLRGLMG
ncbi:MAG: heavy-metal-associated domain-containing protein [Bacteroidota bacterium]